MEDYIRPAGIGVCDLRDFIDLRSRVDLEHEVVQNSLKLKQGALLKSSGIFDGCYIFVVFISDSNTEYLPEWKVPQN